MNIAPLLVAAAARNGVSGARTYPCLSDYADWDLVLYSEDLDDMEDFDWEDFKTLRLCTADGEKGPKWNYFVRSHYTLDGFNDDVH